MQKSAERLDSTFAALADPTRRAILARLASGQASVTALAEPFEMTLPAGGGAAQRGSRLGRWLSPVLGGELRAPG